MKPSYLSATAAILAGCLIIFIGDTLLGVRIEIFMGISTFSFPWMLDVFLVPFIAGLAVAMIHKNRNGKWLAFLPPLIVRCLSCLYLYLTNEQWNADFFYHLHLHYWGLAVILTTQASYLGGMLGGTLSGSYLRADKNKARAGNNEPAPHKQDTQTQQQIGDNA